MEYLSKLESYIPEHHKLNVWVDYRIVNGLASVWVHLDKEQTYKEIACLSEELFFDWVNTSESKEYIQSRLEEILH